MNKTRVNEILSEITAFSSDTVRKEEYLPELKKLQTEIINLTFNEEHASTGELRIWDVEKHLKQMNEANGNVADEELDRFNQGSKELANLIRAEISGSRGEFTVFNTLKNLREKHYIIRNLEICEDEYHTEIDGIVITSTEVIIIEVKNSVKNIYIDERGNFYRTGNYNKLDCNIADKMRVREQAVRDILERSGFENISISSLVVFTNSMVEVTNRCESIDAVFVGQMIGEIEKKCNRQENAIEKMGEIAECLGSKAYEGKYHIDMDIEQYKQDFATLMVRLEEASSEKPENEELSISEDKTEEVEVPVEKTDRCRIKATWKNWLVPVGKMIGTVALSTVTTLIVNTVLGRRE